MSAQYFFGYGSLVNRATHEYMLAHPAKISGWRRTWRHVEGREVAFLTAVPDADSSIDGLIAAVPDADWRALDAREAWYRRDVAVGLTHSLTPAPEVQIYHAPQKDHRPASVRHPILLSYIDVVVQGYLAEFGEAGVAGFFETTDGWDAPVKNDRAAPIYARHQKLDAVQTEMVDAYLGKIGVEVI